MTVRSLNSEEVIFLRLLGTLDMKTKTHTDKHTYIHTYIITHTQTHIISILVAYGLRLLCSMYK